MTRRLSLAAGALLISTLALAADRHPFGVDDWSALRSARPVAISPDGGTILYRVEFGGARGPSNREWRLIGVDGAGGRKLDLPERFTPFGFTRDGGSVYGAFEVNRVRQLAVFALADVGANQTPSLAILLPSGIHSAAISPDGSRYAILASPRPPDRRRRTGADEPVRRQCRRHGRRVVVSSAEIDRRQRPRGVADFVGT